MARISDDGKVSPTEANYVDPSPTPDKLCSMCEYYLDSPDEGAGRCAKVSGAIAPEATCDLFAPEVQAPPPLTDQSMGMMAPTPPPGQAMPGTPMG